MKYLVVFDNEALSVMSHLDPSSVILLVDDNVQLSDEVLNVYSVECVEAVPPEHEINLCRDFTENYNCFLKNNGCSSSLEMHINGIYEYFIMPLNNILFSLKSLVKDGDEILLYGGNEFFKVAPYYAMKSAEFNKDVFFRRRDVFSPFLYEALKNNYKIKYCGDKYAFVFARYFFRVSFIFFFSFLKTVIKYFFRAVSELKNVKSHISFSNEVVFFPVRCNAHMDYVEPIALSIRMYSDVVPVILSYEMLMGSGFFSRIAKSKLPFVSLFRVCWIPLVLLSPVFMFQNMICQYSKLKKNRSTSFSFDDFQYSIDFSHMAFENFMLPHVFIYKLLLKKTFKKIKCSVKGRYFSVLSSEMVGVQSFVERVVSGEMGFSFFNLQVAALSSRAYPVKVVGKKIFCLDDNSQKNINKSGVQNKGKAVFLGKLKYLQGSDKDSLVESNGLRVILYATQPYEPAISLAFLEKLLSWSMKEKNSVKIRVRVHPRDDVGFYKKLTGVEIVGNVETVLESVRNASLVLSRTSSVLLDALSLKKPFVACIFSALDEKINLKLLPNQKCQVSSAEELFEIIDDFAAFSYAYQKYIVSLSRIDGDVGSDADKTLLLLFHMGLGRKRYE